jgi:hypothetical protein
VCVWTKSSSHHFTSCTSQILTSRTIEISNNDSNDFSPVAIHGFALPNLTVSVPRCTPSRKPAPMGACIRITEIPLRSRTQTARHGISTLLCSFSAWRRNLPPSVAFDDAFACIHSFSRLCIYLLSYPAWYSMALIGFHRAAGRSLVLLLL